MNVQCTERVSRLFESVKEPSHHWSDADLRAMLRHQLESPVVVDVRTPSDAQWGREPESTLDNPSIRSLRGLLQHPSPPVELLILVKNFVKSSQKDASDLLPPDIATVLYFACIMTARVRCQRSITQMDDKSLLNGLDWATGLSWIDPELRTILREGRQSITELAAKH